MKQRKSVFTTGQVATICQVAPRTVSKWFDTGQLKGYRVPGSKDRRIPLGELLRFMRAHGMPLGSLDTGKTRVLIVDPDDRRAAAVRASLGERGPFETESAASAFAAGVLSLRLEPHVIVVDETTPGLNGHSFAAVLQGSERLSAVKTVYITSQVNGAAEGAHAGYDARLVRPFEVRELMETIDRLLDRIG